MTDSEEPVPLLRRCSLCGIEKPLVEFHRQRDGHMWWCKACRREYDSRYYAATRDLRRVQRQSRRARLIGRMREMKLQPCMDCGGTFHPAAMQFDHRPGTLKDRDIATLAARGCTGLFEAEIAKCDLVCANCHAVRTYERREAKHSRGTPPSVAEPVAIYLFAA